MLASLQGQVILNTRPAHQQAKLTQLLESVGARVLSFPVIDITLAPENRRTRDLLQHIANYDILLFVSRNAVDATFQFIDAKNLANTMRFGVIGTATASALTTHIGLAPAQLIAGEPYNSEALLATSALRQVTGKRVLILRGQQGRNLLGDELSARGAQVEYCEVYRRQLPQFDTTVFKQLVTDAFPTLVILTSEEGMRNLFELVDTVTATDLLQTPWLLISERMRESALKLGHNAPIIIACNASDEGIQQTLCDWAGHE